MNTLYETIFILHPDQAGKAKEFVESYKKLLEGLGATVTHVEEWGIRDLAYRIHKQGRGYYNLIRYQAGSGAVEELERNLKLSDGVIRYLTVRLEEDAPVTAPPRGRDAPRAPARRTAEEDAGKTEAGP